MAKQVLDNTGWQHQRDVEPKTFKCGFCDYHVSSSHGWITNHGEKGPSLRICPHCKRPTYLEAGEQHPGIPFGESVKHLPSGIAALYDEARICCATSAYTAAVLILRKLLMNIAVQKGASEGLKFIEYVEHLSTKGYVPPDGKAWVDHIRKKGNEATHEIKLMDRKDAEDLVTFSQMLLKFIYEFPSFIAAAPTSTT